MNIRKNSLNLNILVVISSLSPGGAEKSGLKLAKQLSRYSSINVTLAILNPKLIPIVYSIPENISVLKTFHTLPSKTKSRNPIIDLIANKYKRVDWWLTFRSFAQKRNIDLVISFGAEIGCKVYVALLMTGVRQLTCERNELHPDIHPQTLLERLLRPHIYKHGVACSVQTVKMKADALKLWRVDAFLTPNFYEIPRQIFKPRVVKPGTPLRFIFVGNDSYQKNIDLLISTWNFINSNIESHLTVFGSWNPDARLRLEKLNVVFRSPTPDLELVYSNYDVLISTSRFEGFPNVIAEAILHGLKVITTPSTEQLNLWSEKFECFVCNSHSTESFMKFALRSVRSILDSPDRKTFSSDIDEMFSWEANKNYWFEAINSTVNKD